MRCPACRVDISAGEDVTPNARPRPPRVGDIGICPACGTVALLDGDGTLRALDAEQVASLPTDLRTAVTDVQQAVRRVH
jgi:hypothetical protein